MTTGTTGEKYVFLGVKQVNKQQYDSYSDDEKKQYIWFVREVGENNKSTYGIYFGNRKYSSDDGGGGGETYEAGDGIVLSGSVIKMNSGMTGSFNINYTGSGSAFSINYTGSEPAISVVNGSNKYFKIQSGVAFLSGDVNLTGSVNLSGSLNIYASSTGAQIVMYGYNNTRFLSVDEYGMNYSGTAIYLTGGYGWFKVNGSLEINGSDININRWTTGNVYIGGNNLYNVNLLGTTVNVSGGYVNIGESSNTYYTTLQGSTVYVGKSYTGNSNFVYIRGNTTIATGGGSVEIGNSSGSVNISGGIVGLNHNSSGAVYIGGSAAPPIFISGYAVDVSAVGNGVNLHGNVNIATGTNDGSILMGNIQKDVYITGSVIHLSGRSTYISGGGSNSINLMAGSVNINTTTGNTNIGHASGIVNITGSIFLRGSNIYATGLANAGQNTGGSVMYINNGNLEYISLSDLKAVLNGI